MQQQSRRGTGVTIQRITEYRMADGRHVQAQLVSASGHRLKLNSRAFKTVRHWPVEG